MKNFFVLKTISVFLATITLATTVFAAPTPTVRKNIETTGTKAEETVPTETNEQEPLPKKSPTDYTGQWTCINATENFDIKARITEDTITVYLHIMNTDMGILGNEIMALYWKGSYTPPTKEGQHTWVSKTLLTEESRPVLASSDASKTFSIKDGKIYFPMNLTLFGETKNGTITLVPYASETGSACEIGNISFSAENNSIGGAKIHAIVEVKNTGTTSLYLDDSTFYYCDEEDVILKEDNYIKAYPQIIAPGDNGYYYADTTLNDVEDVKALGLNVDLNIYTNRSEILYFETYDIKLTEDYSKSVTATVKVKNPYDKEIKPVVVVVLLDKDLKPLDILKKSYESIPANSTKRIDLSNWYQPATVDLTDVAYYEVFSYIADDQYNFDW